MVGDNVECNHKWLKFIGIILYLEIQNQIIRNGLPLRLKIPDRTRVPETIDSSQEYML